MELSIEHANMVKIWFSLPDRDYRSLDHEDLAALVQVHFPEYQGFDISKDVEAILAYL